MTNENAIVVQGEQGFLQPVISVDDARRAYQIKKDLINAILKEGVDYGIIPGSIKPSLLKPGAEKINSFFGLSTRLTDEEVVNDWTGADHGGEPFFFYKRNCSVYKGNTLIASASGSCNSMEKKYRYRWVAEEDVPEGLDKSKLKTKNNTITEFRFAIDKAETSGRYGKPAEYWERFQQGMAEGTAQLTKKKTSSGKEYDAVSVGSLLYRIPNDEIADLANTILKMADKRAFVAATLISTGMSEYYTQDLEDYIQPGEFIDVVAKTVGGEKENIVTNEADQSQETEDRPYEPATFKRLYGVLVDKLKKKTKGLTVSDMDRKVVASAIDTIFGGEKTMRYEFCNWLVGESSSKKMSPYDIKALLTVMEISGFNQPPSLFSETEIKQAHSEALREQGQQELPMEEG